MKHEWVVAGLRRVQALRKHEPGAIVEGWFHGWGGTSEQADAIIETDGGLVLLCSTAYYNIKFLECEPTRAAAQDRGQDGK